MSCPYFTGFCKAAIHRFHCTQSTCIIVLSIMAQESALQCQYCYRSTWWPLFLLLTIKSTDQKKNFCPRPHPNYWVGPTLISIFNCCMLFLHWARSYVCARKKKQRTDRSSCNLVGVLSGTQGRTDSIKFSNILQVKVTEVIFVR
jgi:hypothetical protein